MSDTPKPSVEPTNDALSSLYRMSKTAGLASSEYQAVNVPSVVALVLGLASYFATFDAILLIIPLAGAITGIVALVQVIRSNGTQTGAWMAVLGIILSLASGAWAGSAKYRESARTVADRQMLVALVDDLWKHVQADNLDAAYDLFSDGFKQRISRTQFGQPWSMFKGQYALKRISSNGLFVFQEDAATRIRVAEGQLIVEFAESGLQTDRPQAIFTYRNGRWAIESIPTYYAPSAAQQAPSPP